jgi:hypothetical protein
MTKWRAMFRQVQREQAAQDAVEVESWSEHDWQVGMVDAVLRGQSYLHAETVVARVHKSA